MTYEENDSEQEPKKINVFAHDNEETKNEDSSEEQSAQDEQDSSSEHDAPSEHEQQPEQEASTENDTPAEEQDNPTEGDDSHDASGENDHENSSEEPDLPDLSDETSEAQSKPEPEAEPETSKQEDSVDSVIEHKTFNDFAPRPAIISAPSPYSSRPEAGTAKPIPSSVHNTADVPKTDAKSNETPKAVFKPNVVTMQNKFNRQYIVYGVLLVVFLGLGYWGYSQKSDNNKLKDQVATLNKQVAALKADPQAIIKEQTDALIAKVGLLTKLPVDETPSVYTVSDVAQAQKQSAFFANAQNGDKTLVYAKAAEAVLYRPSTNKVILVAPLSYNNTSTTAKPAATTPAATAKH